MKHYKEDPYNFENKHPFISSNRSTKIRKCYVMLYCSYTIILSVLLICINCMVSILGGSALHTINMWLSKCHGFQWSYCLITTSDIMKLLILSYGNYTINSYHHLSQKIQDLQNKDLTAAQKAWTQS